MKYIKLKVINQAGLTLVEVLAAAGIIALVIGALLQLLIYCSFLSESSLNLMAALGEAQGKLEEIKNYDYDSISTDYGSGGTPGSTFDLDQIDGKGAIYIDSTNTSLLEVKTIISFRTRNNRIIGEDANLNGVLDAGEDQNSNGELDSPASVVTLIAQK